nr:hypothetical protein [Tanacetum cinerariifolium]
MSNANNTMPTQTSSVLYNHTVSSCSTSKVQEKTQLSRRGCMNSLREIKSQFKFLTETYKILTDCNTTLTKLITTFEKAFNLEFKERMQKYTRFDAQSFKDAMICNKDSIGKYMLEIILHQQQTLQFLKQKKLMQTQEDHLNLIPALNVDSLKVDLVVIQNTCSEKEDNNSENASSKSVKESSLDFATKDVHAIKYKMVNKRQMKTQESMIDLSKALDDDLVVTESSGTESEVQDHSSRSWNDTDADDANIRPIYDEEPMAEVPLTAECNIFAAGQQHTEQPEIINEDEARKKTQEGDRNSKTSVIPSARFQSTADGSKPNPMSTNHSARSLLVSKSSCVTITVVPKADYSKSSSSFLDSKHFVCSICHKCVFNANHDACITKLLKEVNSHAKIQSHKTRNSNKHVDQKSNTQKPGRQIFTRHRFSPNKTSIVYEKTSPRSYLRWKPMGRIFKSVGLSGFL